MGNQIIRRMLVWILMLSMCIGLCGKVTVSAQKAEIKAGVSGLRNPVIKEDSGMEAGRNVTWDCVWFGSYPQAEVVASKEGYTAVDRALLEEGDLIEDSSLYNALKSASGWDANGDITLNGQKYRRMKMSDAKIAFVGERKYFKWENADTFHYFKYEPVKWRVLKKENNQALLLSDVALDSQEYNIERTDITWEESTVRSWLNGYGRTFNKYGKDFSSKNFIKQAFSYAQEQAIVNTNVINMDNLSDGTTGGNNTKDKIFFLSESEVYGNSAAANGFCPDSEILDEARCCKSSVYAKAMGTFGSLSGNMTAEKDGYCSWWLRSPGKYPSYASDVDYFGRASGFGAVVFQSSYGMRPALNLELSSDQYSYAGTVCSDGTEDEKIHNGDQTLEGYKSLEDASFVFTSSREHYYTGQPQCPEFTVTYEGKRLTEGIDYAVSCTNNVNPSFDPDCYSCYGGIYDSKNMVKYAKISVTGKYPYKDTIERYFLIHGFSDLTAAMGFGADYDYTGEEICPKPEIVLYDGRTIGDTLTENLDYRLTYTNNKEPGKATILVTGIGKYEGYGSWHIHFFIGPKDISGWNVLLSADGKKYKEELPKDSYIADGKAKTPDVHVTREIQKDGSYIPLNAAYYDVSYENNVSAGTATVKITGKSPYTGSLTRTFVIGQKEGDGDSEDGFNRFTYQFGNTRKDFGYSDDYIIDEESIFTKLWGNTPRAKGYYDYWTKEFGKWSGNCYGMSATSIMFNDNRDDIEVEGFNDKASLIKELELNDYNRKSNIRMSLLDFIEMMQVSQVDETVSAIIRKSNKGKISRMCSALEDAMEKDSAVIIVLDSSGPQGAHAVTGYRIEDVSGTEQRIYVYDCNHPGIQKYITLTKENGTYTGWRYDGSSPAQSMVWSSETSRDSGCTISYISYDSFVKVWLNRSLGDKTPSEKNIMTMNTANAVICDKNGAELAVLEDGELKSENEEIFEYYPVCATSDGGYDKSKIQPLIYLPADEYIVKNTDQSIGQMQLTMCDVDRMLTVGTSASSVFVHVDDSSKTNIVRVEGDATDVRAEFYSSDETEQYKSMNYIGNVIGSSMTLGVAGGEKVVENFHVIDENIVDKEDGGKDPENEKPEDGKPEDKKPEEQTEETLPFSLVSSTGSNKIAAGKKVKLEVVTAAGTAGVLGLRFQSSDLKAVSVNSAGIVSVKKKAGGKSVVITASDSKGQTARLKLKVMKGAVKKVQIAGKKSCKAGKSVKLKAKVTAGKGANKTALWKSSNPRYATVSKKGVVKTKKAGRGKKVRITAYATDGSGKKGSIKIQIN